MKCAIIIPAWRPEEIFPTKTSRSQINYWEPLGTLYVAASMIKAGHEVRFLNGSFILHEEILEEIEKYAPSFVGIYSTTFGWKKAMQTAEDIKKRHSDIFVFAGGPYPIAVKGRCLTPDAYAVDAVVTGEGELTVVEMLESLEKKSDLQGVKGVVYRKNGEIIDNGPRPLISDLDALPFPAREILEVTQRYIPAPATYRRLPVAVMATSRGCDRQCLFCFQIDRHRESGIRYRGVENVLAEIELCLSQGYREIKFIDDTFAADYERAMRLAAEIRRRNLDFTWFASACVNQVDKALLQAFKDAGCWAILFGVESGLQKDLNAIRKGITLDQAKRAVMIAKEVGLKVFTAFMFGIPGQTFADGLRSIEFACELDPEVANFHALTPFPGTELFDDAEKYGTISPDLDDYTYQGIAFVPHTMTRDDIAELRHRAFKKFYSRPSYLVGRLFSIRSYFDLKAALQGIKSLVWILVKGNIFKRKKR